jgi:hypothetical protein
MELEYSVTRRDMPSIVRGISSMVWRRPENAKRKLMLQAINILLWIPVGIFIAHSFAAWETLGRWALSGVCLGAGIVWLYSWIERKVLNQLPDEPGPSLGPLKMSADENGITVSGATSRTTTEWRGIREIENARDHVLIFIDNHAAHYIPKQAIGAPADVQAFISELASLKARYS